MTPKEAIELCKKKGAQVVDLRRYQIFNPGYLHVGINLLGAIGGTALSSTLPRVAPLG